MNKEQPLLTPEDQNPLLSSRKPLLPANSSLLAAGQEASVHSSAKHKGPSQTQSPQQGNTEAPAGSVSPHDCPPGKTWFTGPYIYPDDLPVTQRKQQIAAAIKDHQVVVISGATGSGKTTQLPKICLELGRGRAGLIGHTQPRRIAARSVATRIASELGQKLGQTIGYQVRFNETLGPDTQVKLMTDGILLAEIQSDPKLLKYDTLIIDEAHERSLNIDFILGYLTNLLTQRPDLKLLITSATIDSQRFAHHFETHLHPKAPIPVIEVSGRTYPVEILYRPLNAEHNLDEEQETTQSSDSAVPYTALEQVEGICLAVEELTSFGPGDILVFLAGESDIRDTDAALAEHLKTRYLPAGQTSSIPGAIEVLPLYARLSPREQQRIFQPHPHRRIVLATNVAETSLTVPGIKYVIDPGNARISRYSNRTKIQRLPIEEISQASANQRSGRCGRTSPGVAIRLYSEENYAQRRKFTEPEILRTSLASVILAMANLNFGDVADFPFIDAPDPKAIKDGEQLLVELGALRQAKTTPRHQGTGRHRSGSARRDKQPPTKSAPNQVGQYVLTPLGRQLAKLPIDPRLARMVLRGKELGCVSEVLIIVSALSMQDVRLRPIEHQQAADQAHHRFLDLHSDFLTYLNLWRYLRTLQRDLSNSAFRRRCQKEFLHYLRIREWQDLVNQLRSLLKQLGGTPRSLSLPASNGYFLDHDSAPSDLIEQVKQLTSQKSDTAAIHRSLLVGMLSTIGNWDQKKQLYQGGRGLQFLIWPGSGLNKRHYDWVMASEIVETSRIFARNAAQISPQWLLSEAKHLVKYSWGEPFWSPKKGQVQVLERVSLFGLTISADQAVSLTKRGNQILDPKETAALSSVTSTLLSKNNETWSLLASFQSSKQVVSFPDDPEILLGSLPATQHQTSKSKGDPGAKWFVPRSAKQWAHYLFVLNALVKEDANFSYPFQIHNRKSVQKVISLEERLRKPGLLADEEYRVQFLINRLNDQSITNPETFARWYRQHCTPQSAPGSNTQISANDYLHYPLELLLNRPALSGTASGTDLSWQSGPDFQQTIADRLGISPDRSAKTAAPAPFEPKTATDASHLASPSEPIEDLFKTDFPNQWRSGNLKLPIEYHYRPGTKEDGLTLRVTLSQLPRLDSDRLDWLVPGLWPALFQALLRNLPKHLRRELVPAPQVAEEILTWTRTYLRELAGQTAATQLADGLNQQKDACPKSKTAAGKPEPVLHSDLDKHSDGSVKQLAATSPLAQVRASQPTPVEQKQQAELQASLTRLAKWAGLDPKAITHNIKAQSESNLATLPSAENSASIEADRACLHSGWDREQTAPEVPLFEVFQLAANHLFAVDIKASDFKTALANLPDHLRFRYRLKHGGKTIYTRSLSHLQKQYRQVAQSQLKKQLHQALANSQKQENLPVSKAKKSLSTPLKPLNPKDQASTGQTTPKHSLPRQACASSSDNAKASGTQAPGGAQTAPSSSSLEMSWDYKQLALEQWYVSVHPFGLGNLVARQLELPAQRIITRWNEQLALQLSAFKYASRKLFISDLQSATTWQLLAAQGHDYRLPAKETTARQLTGRLLNQYEDEVWHCAKQLGQIAETYLKLQRKLTRSYPLSCLNEIQQIKAHCNQLLYSRFVLNYALDFLSLNRWLQTDLVRLEHLDQRGPYQSQTHDWQELSTIWKRKLQSFLDSNPDPGDLAALDHLIKVRKLLEELYVSFFAQRLGTSAKVSTLRLRKLLAEIPDSQA